MCIAKEKGVYPLPALPSPEKDKAPLFFFGKQGECLAVSASSAIVAEAVAPPCPNDCTPRSGREAVCTCVLHILLDFCCAKMAESKSLDSARLVLAHALFILFGKASLEFFGVVDSVSCLDSEKLDSRFCFCESKLLTLDSGLSLDSESA